MDARTEQTVYEFGPFRLDPLRRVLTSRETGQPIALASRAFETLLYLVEHPGELIDKSTLLDAVWPNTVVEENNLHQSLTALRRALRERPGDNQFIVNVPGRGYRFVADVVRVAADAAVDSKQDDAAAPAAAPRRLRLPWLVAGILVSMGVAAWFYLRPPASNGVHTVSSIAVMPFANSSADPDNTYLGDGIADEIIHRLSQVPNLKVPARRSSFAYKDRNVDTRQIARDLRVDAVLEGSVRLQNGRIRLNTQLIDGRSGFQLWSHSLEGNFEDFFELQEALARSIVVSIRPRLPESAVPAGPRPPVKDVETYRQYLRASALTARPTEENLRGAMTLLDEVIAREPLFARAYYTRAYAALLGIVWYRTPGDVAAVERDAYRSLELDPRLSTAHSFLGQLKMTQAQWIAASEHHRAALDLDPNDPGAHAAHGQLAMSTGHLRQALASAQRAFELAPADPNFALQLGVTHAIIGNDEQALDWVDLAVKLGWQEDAQFVPGIRALVARRAGRLPDFIKFQTDALTPELRAAGGARSIELSAAALTHPARAPEARAELVRLRREISKPAPDVTSAWFLIRQLLILDEVDAAFDVAGQAAQAAATQGVLGWMASGEQWVREFEPFRRHSRYQTLAKQLRLLEFWERHGAPDLCDFERQVLTCH